MLHDLRYHLIALAIVVFFLAAVTVVEVPMVTTGLFDLGTMISLAAAIVGFTKAALVGSVTASICFATMFSSLMLLWYWAPSGQETAGVELIPLAV